ncbi:MAG: small basic protein [Candidatus Omnitrophota bacterium]|nr:small basic protein [Candidatus Omnitrophota bacterium]
MGLHSSLKRAEKMTASRSVMKRSERIKWLMEKGLWKEKDRVLGLPKIKVIKLKAVKKEKAKEEAKPEAAAATSAIKPASGAKSAAK